MELTVSNSERGDLAVIDSMTRLVVQELSPGFEAEWNDFLDHDVLVFDKAVVKEKDGLTSLGDVMKDSKVKDLDAPDFISEMTRQGYELGVG